VQVIRVGGRYEHHESEPHEDVELFSSLWSALKLNFAEWQQRAVTRRLERTAADIEASRVFWHDDVS
jgi:hypothetical protein